MLGEVIAALATAPAGLVELLLHLMPVGRPVSGVELPQQLSLLVGIVILAPHRIFRFFESLKLTDICIEVFV